MTVYESTIQLIYLINSINLINLIAIMLTIEHTKRRGKLSVVSGPLEKKNCNRQQTIDNRHVYFKTMNFDLTQDPLDKHINYE